MRTPLVLVLAYLLIMGAWSVSNPPGAAPDEYAHYLRALAAGRGDLVLSEPAEPLTGGDKGLRFQRSQARLVEVSAALTPEIFNCGRLGLVGTWDCPNTEPIPAGPQKEMTWVGTYPPFLYVIPGLAMRFAGGAVGALILGRLASMAVALALFAGAIFLLYDPARRWASVLGPVVAITPMAVFVGSSLTPNGQEIAAGACFAAALFRLTRHPEGQAEEARQPAGPAAEAPQPAGPKGEAAKSEKTPDEGDGPSKHRPNVAAWLALAISGVVLVAGRDLGPAWLVLYGLLAAGLAGFRGFGHTIRSGGRWSMVAAAALGIGLVTAVYWQLTQQVHAGMELGNLLASFTNSLDTTKEVLRQEIGVFGQLAVVMPPFAYGVWGVMLASLGALALVAGTTRERLVLALAILGGWLVPVGIDMLQRQGGFGVQGRHAMPFTIGIPLLAGEILTRHARELSWLERLRPAVICGAVSAAILSYGWYLNGKLYMVGYEGPDPFWSYVDVQPPAPWEVLVGIVGLGAALMVTCGYSVSRPHRKAAGTDAVEA